ncbi:hypothetical protein ACJ72_06736 [Emergomyces africanus]|uniref:Uncharacterized protein n=1 Tax=Emergomyces africanus TaxID=1955775 RepID=A0A1B7NQ60_9EURO|nr:hypothetical protein ACJ72_06736 [Emergomyces africanus]
MKIKKERKQKELDQTYLWTSNLVTIRGEKTSKRYGEANRERQMEQETGIHEHRENQTDLCNSNSIWDIAKSRWKDPLAKYTAAGVDGRVEEISHPCRNNRNADRAAGTR